jgi:Putative metallopeptidase
MITRQLASLLVVASILIAAPGVQARDSIDVRIAEASERLATLSDSLAALHPRERERVVQFVVGNALFTLAHEFGHALVSDLRLPVLGREEDAVDIFATLALLHVGTDFAHGVLVHTAKGLMLAGEREARMGVAPAFYGEHGLDQQRAYKILCLMVGSDPEAFRGLAQDAMLPKERQETCQADFELAKASWLSLLAPNLRQDSRRQISLWERLARRLTHGSRQPELSIEVRYSEAVGELRLSQMVLRTVGVIEIVREFAIQNLVGLQGGLTIEAKTCGTPNAFWDPAERRIALCYELVDYQADLALSLIAKP